MKKVVVGILAVAVAGVAIVVALMSGDGKTDASGTPPSVPSASRRLALPSGTPVTPPVAEDCDGTEADADSTEEEPQTEEEKREAEEEAKVDAFDNLTDKWMEPSEKGVTMAEVDNFVKQFRQIPKARRDECVHRALNLIPDENVMLLAGILMDKTMDKEIVETVYNDILNRDEDVKKPILQQIFKDKSHPCWADTAWILDVTGELPKKN